MKANERKCVLSPGPVQRETVVYLLQKFASIGVHSVGSEKNSPSEAESNSLEVPLLFPIGDSVVERVGFKTSMVDVKIDDIITK